MSYRTTPTDSNSTPAGIPYIIGNEFAERFSFYGMRGILVIFMTQYMLNASGQPDFMSEEEARGWFHLFVSAVYLTPLLGALISDGVLGKYRTIIVLSIVYTLGHFMLSIDDTRTGLAVGLALIALGAGGIKPCVSAHVGDQFGTRNAHLLPRVYSWFYFSINVGAFTSSLMIPWVLEHHGSTWAFGIPGVLMLAATVIFWSGRNRFVHIPPAGKGFVAECFSPEGLRAIGKLSVIYLFVAVFWSLFDQTGSSWVLQAEKMDRELLGVELLSAQITAANPLLVMILIPLFSYVIYPALDRVFALTPLRKISIGMFVAAAAFAIPTWVQMQIDNGAVPHINWQLLAYLGLTAAEVMISITCLEFSYTQAPARMKSFIMAFFMMSIAIGNLFTSGVNFFIQNEDGSSKLAGADYFLFFTLLMLVTAVLFMFVARGYREQTYIQKSAQAVE